MADITMCRGQQGGEVCPIKDTCYRHTATQNEFRQSWFMDIPLVVVAGVAKCEYYWDERKR